MPLPLLTKAAAGGMVGVMLYMLFVPSAVFAEAPGKLYHDGWVPYTMEIDGPQAGTVSLCKLDHDSHARQPDRIPMFRDLAKASHCKTQHRDVPLAEFRSAMRALLDEAGADQSEADGPFPHPIPTGFVFHEARVGSTLVANMLASSKINAVYAESTPPVQVLGSTALNAEERIRLLQEVFAAMSRVPGRKHTFYKFQSALSTKPQQLLQAFPNVPWVFLYRHPTEVMASMFQTLSHPDQLSGGGPCVRHRDNPAPFVKQLLAVDGKTGLTATKPQFCAAHLAHICKVMHDALEAPNSMGIPMDYRLLPGVVPAIVREHFKLPLSDSDEARMLDTSTQYSKARGSRGGGFESDAEKKRQSVPEDVERWSHAYLFDAYHSLASMTKTKVAFLTKEQKDDLQGAMDAIAAKGPPRRRSLLPLTDEADAHHSQQALAAGATFLAAWRSLREDMVNEGKAEAFNATKRAAEAARQSLARRDRRHLATVPPGIDPATWPEGFQNPPPNSPGVAVESTPIGRPPPGYPQSFPLVDMLRDWDADDVWVPKNYGKYASLKTFDFTKDLAEATLYREMEVPFVIRNVPALQAAVKKWSDEGYLKQAFGSKKKMVEHSKDNHHMFYARGRKRHDPNWKPPTEDIFISFSDWLDKAKKLGAQIRNGEVINNQTDHYYFRVSSAERLPDGKPAKGRHSDLFDNPFIGKDLSMFDRDQPFFIVDGSEQRGIHCRFGMEGVMAECHYDSGRNFVALMRGMKRYILSSPDECPNLDMYMKGPSARHTKGNWGDIDYAKAKLAKASAMEAILQAGDMLYIPSGWFHHIISMTLNYQCNTRSGNPAIWQEEISSCGFRLGSPEKDYEAKHQARLEAAQAEYEATHKAPVHPADKVPANAGQPVGLRGGNA